jgi:Hypothetical protein (DUF2513)
MKRDLDLIRQILLKLEADEPCNLVEGVDEFTITKHLGLLLEAGLIKGIAHETDQSSVYWVDVDRLTWSGHDFLDSARN